MAVQQLENAIIEAAPVGAFNSIDERQFTK